MAADPCIQVEHVSKRFGKKIVIDDVSLNVHAGEIFGLLGPSGAGKTTLVRMIAGIDQASEGAVRVLGADMPELTTMKRIGFMAQSVRSSQIQTSPSGGWFRRSPRVFLLDFQFPDPIDQGVPGMPHFMKNLDSKKITDQMVQIHASTLIVHAMCHEGNMYYNSKIGHKHSDLGDRDLLAEFSELCRAKGLNLLFYNCLAWNRRAFEENPEYRVILLSSDKANSGSSLTEASHIFLIDVLNMPKHKSIDTETQAIGRSVRLGQKKSVKVVRFITRATVEEVKYKENKYNLLDIK